MGCDRAEPADSTAQTAPHDATASDAIAPFSWPVREDPLVVRIDVRHQTIEGSIEIELMPELAPNTVEQMLVWVDEGYFDGTSFHRVIQGFMIQGGDPNSRDADPRNDGLGGPGFSLDDELSDAPFSRGTVAMSNTGRPNTTGSQFFIVQGDPPGLSGRYNVIGRVRSGMDIVDAIAAVETDKLERWGPRDRPFDSVVIERVRRAASTTPARATEAATRRSPVESAASQR